MTKQRPASLDGSLLVKKGQAKPSVAPAVDPVAKKVSRFPNPETISELPLTSTPPIGELYGTKNSEETEPDPAPKAQAPVVTPPEDVQESAAPISAPIASQDDRAAPEPPVEDDADTPEPRLVFLLPRPSLRTVLSLLLVAVMGASAWYLMNSSDNSGTQRLASVGATEEAAPPEQTDTASAISPPPSGAVSSKTPPPAKSSSARSPQTAAKKAPVPSEKPALVTNVSASSGPQYAIQLLATKSTQAGRSAWDQISAKHGDQLGDLGLDLQTVTLQGRGTFVRVRAGPIGEKKVAVSRCKALSAAGQDCLVVRF